MCGYVIKGIKQYAFENLKKITRMNEYIWGWVMAGLFPGDIIGDYCSGHRYYKQPQISVQAGVLKVSHTLIQSRAS